ncbi:MAG: hypothetical protein WD042_08700 [Phycisphaeraceae bacterium]
MEFDTADLASNILGDVKPTKSVICTLLAFIEAIHQDLAHQNATPSRLEAVLRRELKKNGVVAQGTRAAQHLKRFGLPTEKISGDLSGRKTPQSGVVVPRLVEYLDSQGYEEAPLSEKVQMLHAISEPLRSKLGLSLGPMKVTRAGNSGAAVVEEILAQANERGIESAIAELLVGSKLEICVDGPHSARIAAQHKWVTGHDDPEALGDYRIENVAIEITMVQGPDESHRTKANRITKNGTDECWLVVRSDKIKAWQDYLAKAPSKYPGLVRCYGICELIGQNLTETRWRSPKVPSDPLKTVTEKVNELVAKLGPQYLPAARIDLVE